MGWYLHEEKAEIDVLNELTSALFLVELSFFVYPCSAFDLYGKPEQPSRERFPFI